MWQGINQRRFPRANYQCIVKLKSKNSTSEISANTENIGMGGICVLLEHPLEIFSTVEVALLLEKKKSPAVFQGTVVWVVQRRQLKKESRYDTGIEFTEISPEQKAALESILDQMANRRSLDDLD